MYEQEIVSEALPWETPAERIRPEINLTDFKRTIYRRYQHAPHLQAIDDALTSASRYAETGGKEGIGFLIIEMPPRSGKTITTSRLFPVWHLGRNPDHRIILASYGATLAHKNSRVARNFIASPIYRQIFGINLAPDSKAVDAWDVSGYYGGMDAVGIGGGIAGKGANLIICDDPIKSREEAESETIRENIWEWFTDDLYTRREPGAAVVVVMTRWNQDDLVGRLLRKQPQKWHELRLPAIAEENDPIGRSEGEALWPERFSVEDLRETEVTMGPYGWAGLYQQRPTRRTGGLFDASKIQIVDYVPVCKKVVRFYDLALTTKRKSDYTVAIKLGVTEDEMFVILHMWRDQKELPDVQEAIVQNAQMDGEKVAIRLEGEKSGIIQLQFILRDERMHRFTIDAVPPVGDKYTRAGPAAARVNNRRFMMVRGDWNQAVLDELSLFPAAAHDDIPDGLSGAYDMLTNPSGKPTTMRQGTIVE